jgi:hypothetical protein
MLQNLEDALNLLKAHWFIFKFTNQIIISILTFNSIWKLKRDYHSRTIHFTRESKTINMEIAKLHNTTKLKIQSLCKRPKIDGPTVLFGRNSWWWLMESKLYDN